MSRKNGAELDDIKIDANDGEAGKLVQLYKTIKDTIVTIKANTEKIADFTEKEKKTSRKQDREALVKKHDQMRLDTNKLFTAGKKELDARNEEILAFAKSKPKESTGIELRRNLFVKHVKDYQAAVQGFNEASDEFKNGMIKTAGRQMKNYGMKEDDIKKVLEADDVQKVLQELVSEELEDAVEELQSRHDEIAHLETQIREVQQLFVDLATLVDMQGEQLDTIQGHIEKAKTNVEKGEVALGEGEKYLDKARKKQCCILLIVVAVLTAVLVPTILSVVGKG